MLLKKRERAFVIVVSKHLRSAISQDVHSDSLSGYYSSASRAISALVNNVQRQYTGYCLEASPKEAVSFRSLLLKGAGYLVQRIIRYSLLAASTTRGEQGSSTMHFLATMVSESRAGTRPKLCPWRWQTTLKCRRYVCAVKSPWTVVPK
jgi:hypothetical protein